MSKQQEKVTCKFQRSKAFIGVLQVKGNLCFIMKRGGYIELVLHNETYHLHGICQHVYEHGYVPERLSTVDIVNHLTGKADGILFADKSEYLLYLTDALWLYSPETKVTTCLHVTMPNNVFEIDLCTLNI